jgi:hypothetical protein
LIKDRLGLPADVIKAEPSTNTHACLIAHPLTLTTLPADLRKWQGVEALTEYLPVVQGFLQRCPRSRMVTILDPVAGALKLASSAPGWLR